MNAAEREHRAEVGRDLLDDEHQAQNPEPLDDDAFDLYAADQRRIAAGGMTDEERNLIDAGDQKDDAISRAVEDAAIKRVNADELARLHRLESEERGDE